MVLGLLVRWECRISRGGGISLVPSLGDRRLNLRYKDERSKRIHAGLEASPWTGRFDIERGSSFLASFGTCRTEDGRLAVDRNSGVKLSRRRLPLQYLSVTIPPEPIHLFQKQQPHQTALSGNRKIPLEGSGRFRLD